MPRKPNPSPDYGYPAKTWRLTPKGYVRFVLPKSMTGGEHRQKLGHVWVWEQHHGPVPEGKQVHHKNEDKTDNRIENLELVDALTHKRMHSGCIKVDGEWQKPCRKCGETKPATPEYWYLIQGKWLEPECKKCRVARSVNDKQQRRAKL